MIYSENTRSIFLEWGQIWMKVFHANFALSYTQDIPGVFPGRRGQVWMKVFHAKFPLGYAQKIPEFFLGGGGKFGYKLSLSITQKRREFSEGGGVKLSGKVFPSVTCCLNIYIVYIGSRRFLSYLILWV